MGAKMRRLTNQPSVAALGQCDLPNLLVAGCSYVWNNSEEHVCSWPYYLQDILDMHQVFDCSQSGGGPDLVFNSVINEITTNATINASNTLVIVMWPELSRTDVIVEHSKEIDRYHHTSLQLFTEKFCNLSIFNDTTYDKDPISEMASDYKKIVSPTAQQYESLIKILGLAALLSERKFQWLFMPWKTMSRSDLHSDGIPASMISALDLFEDILPLDDYADKTGQRIPNDGHPTSEAHLLWTRQHLLPCLADKWPSLIKIN